VPVKDRQHPLDGSNGQGRLLLRTLADTHTHTARCGHAGGEDEAYVLAAVERGLGAIAVTDHLPLYWLPEEQRDPTLAMAAHEFPRYVEAVLQLGERWRGTIEVLLGVEADFVAGAEGQLGELLSRYPFDVVLGSVHWLEGWWVDAPGSVARYRRGQEEVDAIWDAYTSTLIQAARSGLFDVLAHLDLPKKFGFRPSRPFAGRLEEVVAAIRESGCAVELSSAGRRKPVGEDYPSLEVLHALATAGVPLVLASDAHAPAEVGFAFSELLRTLHGVGVAQVHLFRRRQRLAVPLPAPC